MKPRIPDHSKWRRFLHVKLRFAMARLPLCPARYRLVTPGVADDHFLWTRVMPFIDPDHGAFDFQIRGWDARELRFLRRYLRSGMRFIDVGAHHGLYSILASRCVGPEGSVSAFEPEPGCFRRLRWHTKLNGAAAVELFPCGLGAREETAEFHVPTRGIDTVSSLRPNAFTGNTSRRIRIRLVPLDSIACKSGAKTVDFVKLDAEGAELLILDGAAETIRLHQPLWLFEALDDTASSWGHAGRDLVARFLSMGCSIYGLREDGLLLPHEPRQSYPLDSNCNLLAVPASRSDGIRHLIHHGA